MRESEAGTFDPDDEEWSWGAPRTRTLLTDVGRLDSQPVFLYYSFDGSGELTTPLDGTLATPIATNSTARVVRVDVAFEARPSSGNAEQSRRSGLRTSVYLRNTDHSGDDAEAERTWGPRCD